MYDSAQYWRIQHDAVIAKATASASALRPWSDADMRVSPRVVCSGLEDGSLRQRAQAVGSDLIDELNGIDYQNYFDAMGTPGKRGGQQEAQFAAFSLSAAHAAQV
jgi:hypothetical protein